jgi:hypothetical protein
VLNPVWSEKSSRVANRSKPPLRSRPNRRAREAHVDDLPEGAGGDPETQILAPAAKIALRDADVEGEVLVELNPAPNDSSPVGCSCTATCRTVRSARFPQLFDGDVLEEAEPTNIVLGAVDEHAVERIPLDKAQFAADDRIQRTDVADHIDPLDVHARTLRTWKATSTTPVSRLGVSRGRMSTLANPADPAAKGRASVACSIWSPL